jgi:hypothetical protein
MATVVGQCSLQPLRMSKKESVGLYLHFTVDTGAAIVTANTVTSDPGLTVTKGATGRYDVVLPKGPGDAVYTLSPSFTGTFPTAGQFVRVSAKDFSAGTMSITTSTTYGGAAADTNQVIEFDLLVFASMGK